MGLLTRSCAFALWPQSGASNNNNSNNKTGCVTAAGGNTNSAGNPSYLCETGTYSYSPYSTYTSAAAIDDKCNREFDKLDQRVTTCIQQIKTRLSEAVASPEGKTTGIAKAMVDEAMRSDAETLGRVNAQLEGQQKQLEEQKGAAQNLQDTMQAVLKETIESANARFIAIDGKLAQQSAMIGGVREDFKKDLAGFGEQHYSKSREEMI